MLENPPWDVEAYPIPEMRFAAAASELLETLDGQRPFTLIEYAAAGGAGWLISQRRRHCGRFAGALLAANLSHDVMGAQRTFDEQHWLDLGMAICARVERQSIEQADVLVSPTLALASRLGYSDRDVLIRWVPPPAPFKAGDPSIVRLTGPLAHHRRPDLAVSAAVAVMDSDRTSRLQLVLDGPDTDTGPMGRSCASRVARYVPDAFASRISIAPAGHSADRAGIFVFAGEIASDPGAFLAAAVSPVRVIASDVAEHRELAHACGRS